MVQLDRIQWTQIHVLTVEHNAGGPYIMFAGTPYEHLMVAFTEMKH
jgi:hypothetical protein